jgi:hypothetical protein
MPEVILGILFVAAEGGNIQRDLPRKAALAEIA